MPNIDKLTISRKRWGQYSMVNDNGTMCCLALACEACGVPVEKMKAENWPNLNWIEQYGINPWLADVNSARVCKTDAERAAFYNDAGFRGKLEEDKIIQIFARNGIELTIVD